MVCLCLYKAFYIFFLLLYYDLKMVYLFRFTAVDRWVPICDLTSLQL